MNPNDNNHNLKHFKSRKRTDEFPEKSPFVVSELEVQSTNKSTLVSGEVYDFILQHHYPTLNNHHFICLIDSSPLLRVDPVS